MSRAQHSHITIIINKLGLLLVERHTIRLITSW